MRHLVLLCALYALIVALVLPSSLFASGQPPAETAAEPAPTLTEEPAEEPAAPELPAETTPTETAPAPEAETTPAPAPEPPAETTPAAPAPKADEAPAPPAEAAQAEAPADERPAKKSQEKKKKKVQARAAADQTVTISDYKFTPPEVTVGVGEKVTWTNDGPAAHSATADDGSFNTKVFAAGESRSVTFDQDGTFTYYCEPHPEMQGTVVVRAAGSLGQAEEDLEDAEDDLAAAEDELAAAGDLPDTGRDARVVALAGLLMLALGAVLRLRARAQS